ncbi:MAG: HAD family phosphatase [Candidatus Micrarchaeota archaeon]
MAIIEHIKAAVIDLDGTIIDSVEMLAEMWSEAFNKEGINLTKEQAIYYIGIPSKSIIKNVVGREDKNLEERLNKIKNELIWKKAETLRAFPDAISMLEKLKSKGIKLVIASAAGEVWVKFAITKCSLDKYIDAYISGEKVKNPKPAPDIFVEAFKLAGVEPKDGVVIGDRETDTAPGMLIGALTILVDRDSIYKGRDVKANIVVDNLDEAYAILTM